MAELRTEEEQLEAIKNWWKENGKSTLFGVALAMVAVFGWRGWQENQQVAAENASITYQNMLQAAMQPAPTEEQQKTAAHLARTLKSDYTDSGYAIYAALWLSKRAVEQQDYAAASEELNWVLAQSPNEQQRAIAQLRLAKVYLAQEAYDQALSTVEQITADAFKANREELKGDIYLAQGRVEEARAAYQQAKAALPADQARPVLDLKLDDLVAAGEV